MPSSLFSRRSYAALRVLPFLALSAAPLSAATTWKLVWSDEFNGSTIDTSKWNFEVNGQGGGNNELQYYTDRTENARVENGNLIIEARKETFTGTDGTRSYTSARLNSTNKGDWKYGRIEVRAKLPIGRGLWPAIWMLPTDNVYGGWPHSGEIDIMELIGQDPITVYGTLHYANAITGQHQQSNGSPYILSTGATFNDDFHVFALEWEQNEIRWYVDGTLYETQTSWSTDAAAYPAPYDQRFHMVLNVAVGGSWPGSPDSTTVFPQQMVIDYVRVYQAVSQTQTPPTITVQPQSTSVAQNSKVTMSVVANGTSPLSYQWYKGGTAVTGATSSYLTFPSVATTDAGAYTVTVTNANGNVTSSSANLTVTSDTFTPPSAPLINLSTRANVGTGANVLIAGFVVGGSGTKKVLIRAVGPTLALIGVPSSIVLKDPVLTLTKQNGDPVASNDDWYLADNATEIAAVTGPLTFGLPAQSSDSAMIVALPPGNYTATVTGYNNTTGVALVEIYDLEPTSTARLMNISSRANVGTGANIMIAGFVVGGSGSRTALIRAAGPTLSLLSVPGVLNDPYLKLTTQSGTTISENDNWGDSPNDPAAIINAANSKGAFGFTDGSKDAAMISTRSSGAYTALVTGVGDTSGVALVELYDME